MKKFLLSIFAVMLAVFSVQAEEYSYTFTSKQFSANGTKALNNVNWTLAGNGSYWGYDATKGQQFGSGNAPYKSLTLSTSGIEGTISKIVINTSGATSIAGSCTVTVGGTQFGNKITLTKTATAYTLTGNASGNIVLSYTQTSSKAIYIKSITITYTPNSGEGGDDEVVKAASPSLPESCSFEGEKEIEIMNNTADATVYYSTDGVNFDKYTEPFTIYATTTVTAYAQIGEDKATKSSEVSAKYTKLELQTIAEVLNAGVGEAMTRGTVVATYSRGFLLGDGTGYILVYQGGDKGIVAGDFVTVSGATSEYGSLLQFGNTAVVERTGTAEVVHPNVTTMDAAAMDAYLAKPSVQYVEYTGTLSVDTEKGYYNVAIDGAKTAVGSISYPKAGIVEAEDGDVVKVTGYTIGVSSSKYVNTMAVSVEVVEGDDTDPEEPTEPEVPENPGDGEDDDDVVTGEFTDVLNRALTGVSGTNYVVWSGKKATSEAVYAGNSAGGNESIQLRSNNSNSGIVTTESGGKVRKIVVEWNSNTASGRTLSVYGKSSAYSSPTELYATDQNKEQGTELGTIVCGTSTELIVEGDYEFVGLRSKSGAMYLNSISIVWEVEEDEPVAETWSSFYAAFPVAIPEGVEAYIVTAANASYVTLTQIYNAVPANTGVILKGGSIEATYDNYYSGEVTEVTGNLLKGTMTNTDISEEAYVLGKVDGVIGLYKAKMTDGVWLNNANKAYLPASAVAELAQGAASFSFRFGEGTTGVEKVEIRNEKEEIFDLTGRRVEAITAPGIYIVNGKKVLVK